MLQSLKKAVLGSILNTIPNSTDPEIKQEIEDNVMTPTRERAEELAAWCVSEYRNKIRADKPSNGVVLQRESEIPYKVFELAEAMLVRKGWYIKNWDENRIYVAPCEPRDEPARSWVII